MSSEQRIIELSVRETNELRAKLGLAPLRGVGINEKEKDDHHALAIQGDQRGKLNRIADSKEQDAEQVLELSVDETNLLRDRLGLAPLRTSSNNLNSKNGGAVQHVPAVNLAETRAAQERIERARLQRLVQQGMEEHFSKDSLAASASNTSSSSNVKSWAQQMRQQQQKTKQQQQQQQQQQSSSYSADDVAGLSVAHRLADMEHGSTTLTLADSSILQTDTHNKVVGLNDEEEQLLENVHLVEARRQQDGLQKKRQLELGAGRAGGYAGFDDDEFEELGGTQAPSRMARLGLPASSSVNDHGDDNSKKQKKRRGFQIGTAMSSMMQEDEHSSDLFAPHKGKAISLEPVRADVIASDFLTVEEDHEASKKKKNKEPKFKKKKKEKKPKSKKRQQPVESDDEDGEGDTTIRLRNSKGLLQELEETAVDNIGGGGAVRKRRRENEEETEGATSLKKNDGGTAMDVDKSAVGDNKRAKFEAIMAKGNERTKQAFQTNRKSAVAPKVDLDDEPDDAFLNAALSKARRLNRLKELSDTASSRPPTTTSAAEAVAEAVQSGQNLLLARQLPEAVNSSSSITGGTIDFSVDETREFTRALQARTEQQERMSKKIRKAEPTTTTVASSSGSSGIPRVKVEDAVDDEDGDTDMAELAKEVEEDAPPPSALDGATGATVQLGRGLGGVLGLLQQTGEFTRKHAGKEELRGRAKDERHYQDYEALDLSQVVRIDERTATDKDKEVAKRQIKLEYRDKHGRLLTRKEAFRDLSYQFHGYGSGKRKEEKKMAQIAREQAEARQSQTVGTLGALQATQKATGKAYVVHKT